MSRCHLHEQSDGHRDASVAYRLHQVAGAKGNVMEHINSAANRQNVSDKQVLLTLFRAAYYLFKHEIAHTTNWDSLLNLLADADFSGRLQQFFAGRPRNCTYRSSNAIVDILEACSTTLDSKNSTLIKCSLEKFGYFAVMADEETNINTDQILSVCVRYIDVKTSQVVERFLACTKLSNTDAVSVTRAIEQIFTERGIDLKHMCAFSSDGASNFSGVRVGVQAQLRKKYNPDAVFIHCRSHALHLVAQRAANDCKPVKRCISMLGDLYRLFSKSPKRTAQLRNVQSSMNLPSLTVVEPSSTRWLAYERCVDRVLAIYPALLIALEHIHMDAGDLSSTAGGLLLHLRQTDTIMILCVLNHILTSLGMLSRYFQSETSNLAESYTLTESTITSLEQFDCFSESASKCEKLITALRSEDITVVECGDAPSVRSLLMPYMSSLCNDLRIRFDIKAMSFLRLYDIFQPLKSSQDAEVEFDFNGLLKELVPNDRDAVLEAPVFRRWVCTKKESSSLEIMTQVATGSEREVFPAIARLAVQLLVTPIGTASVERSFSNLNRILVDKRNRLLPVHQDCLLRVSSEGPDSVDNSFLDAMYAEWSKKPRRFMSGD
jgi:hypothetical protein